MNRPVVARLLILLIALLGLSAVEVRGQAAADGRGAINGRFISAGDGSPIADVQVMLPALKQLTFSDANGRFGFSELPFGTYTVIIGGYGIDGDTIRVYVNGPVAHLKEIKLQVRDSAPSPADASLPMIDVAETETSSEDEGVRQSSISGLLSAARDPFLSTISFVFAPYRFQARGYSRNTQEVVINGSPMNDVETGDAYWALWGGLNDVFRSRSNTYGLQASPYAFGGIGGSVYFDATASAQPRQTRLTYSLTNRSYRNRIALTKSSGLMQSGWAYTLSFSGRWAGEGAIPGTFYEGYSYFLGFSRQFGGKHEINVVSFGAPARRGRTTAVTAEAVEIAGSTRYNPAWGYQSGEKRNSRISNSFQPIAIIDYRYAPSNRFRWRSSVSYQLGALRNSALDYYNGSNPRPDYYRYLPSYYVLSNTDPLDPDPGARAEFYTERQIDWARMYSENRSNNDSIVSEAGIAGNTVKGRRSVTVQFNDVEEIKKLSLSSNLEYVLSRHVTVNGGIQAILQRMECYRELTDLLGGDFYLNLNQFAFQQNVPDATFNQYDLNVPDRAIREGDKYNYHYISRFSYGSAWLQAVFAFSRIDFFLAGRGTYNGFQRDGLYRNGLFAENSFGKSKELQFLTFGVKGGVTYKLDGRNYLFVHGSYGREAPSFDNSFVSPRTRNDVVPLAAREHYGSVEGGYLFRHPRYYLRVAGYASEVRDGAEIRRFYNDDPAFRGFVNYVMRGISLHYTGVELATEMRLRSSFSVLAVAVLGQAFYSENPSSVTIYRDNDTARTPVPRSVFIQNYFLAAGPQCAYTVGCSYRAKRYWYAGFNLNCFDRSYVAINPDRRTEEAVAGLEPGSELFNRVLNQERLPAVFTVDISAGKTWLLSKYSRDIPRNTFLYLNAGISNLLDAGVRTGGFEQLRYDFVGQMPDKFANKYFYNIGRNFFINVSLKY